jgi:mercury(II) reductase
VPSKTLIRATETLHQASAAQRFSGISASARIDDWGAVARQKDDLVASLRQAKYVDLLPEYNHIAYLEGKACLQESGVLVGGVPIAAAKIIIATGARPAIPDILGIASVGYLTTTTALELTALPRSLLVIGGGYAGAELAQMFSRAGVAVTLVFRSKLLPEAESEIGAALQSCFTGEGMKIVAGVSYRAIRETSAGIALDISRDGRPAVLEAERVLIATGRTPNTEGLGLAEVGIGLSTRGAIAVDAHMRTSCEHVYAAGDVTGRDQFVYMAAYGAKLAAKNALNGDSLRYDSAAMPAVVFTDPQVASVGLTEVSARAAGYDVRVSVLALDQLARALAARDARGLIKLVADAKTRRLLGAHILAPEGADSIQTAALAIRHKLSIDDLAEAIFPYLTTVEGIKLPALAFSKDVAKLSCCAG